MIASPLKIAIVGKSTHSNGQAPWDDHTWQIWWISSGAHILPRWNAVLEVHDLGDGFKRWAPEYIQWLGQKHSGVVYTQQVDPRVPSSEAFPKDAVVEKYGTYFSSSISWAIGLAMHQGASEIGLWGVDMAGTSGEGEGEYEHQRPSCEYLLGMARGAGIGVYVHPNSSLLKCRHLYGFDLQACEQLRLLQQRKDDLRKRAAEAKAVKEKAFAAEQRMLGGLEQLQLIEQWS